MNLADLTRTVDSETVTKLIKTQFGTDYNIGNLGLKETVTLLNDTDKLIVEFKLKNNLHSSENDPSYMKLLMVNEAVDRRATELTKVTPIQESEMENKLLTKALKIAAMGGKLSEDQLQALRITESMQSVLRNQKTAQTFMRKIIESKRAMLAESEIASAQTTIAAQDIADQIQAMIEKFADIKYKELPALHDSIRNAQGVDQAESFNTQLVGSLDSLTSSLEQAKADVNNAVAELTGQEVAAGAGDLDLDGFGGDEMGGELDLGMGDEMDMDLDLDGDGGEFDLDLEADDEAVDLGRERR